MQSVINKEFSEPLSDANVQLVNKTVYPILFTISFTHLLNDTMQAVIPAVYPLIKESFQLSYGQIGMITFAFQMTASIFQPFVGLYTDKKPKPFSLAIGALLTLAGLLCLSAAYNFTTILMSVSLIGLGSSVFHPESSRVALLASGGKKGLAQSIFQLGGNAGSAIGPLLAAIIIVPYGQRNILWFSLLAVAAFVILLRVGKWYRDNLHLKTQVITKSGSVDYPKFTNSRIIFSIGILLILIFSKYFYLASMTSYFTFFLIDKFQLTIQQSQVYLFTFLAAVAMGTIIGGPLGDRFGRKSIIWVSILGAAPFTILLPYANLFWTGVLAAIIGVIIASAFSAILVYATDLVPNKVGMMAGLFFGFAFGMGGIGSAVLGKIADQTSIQYVFQICAFLPLIGIVTILLPNIETRKTKT